MRVLLTGAFGNVGQNALQILLKKGYSVCCFDLKNPRNIRVRNRLRRFGTFETLWGDIRDSNLSKKLVKGKDYIIHLAAIIPPLAYELPDVAYDVNVNGSINLIKAAENLKKPPKFVYASSIAVHGNRMAEEPPTKVDDPLDPLDYDNYAKHKVKVESYLRQCLLPWTILRFAAITPYELGWDIPELMFEVPLDQRIELVDSRDVGLACVNAFTEETTGKIFFIGGGENNQMLQREYVSKVLDAVGIGMLPEEAFKPVNCEDDYYHCDWMDTEEAQKLLNFQRFSFDDFLKIFRRRVSFRRFIIKLFKPIVRIIMLKKSPYYRKNQNYKTRRKNKKITPY